MQIALYKNGECIEREEYSGLTSDILLPILHGLIKRGVKKFIYTSGPGSHMSTKISYTLLKTIEIVRDIPFYAISAFDLNDGQPIKAIGKLYFIKEKENIITKKFEERVESNFFMPDSLNGLKLIKSNEPDYHIAAV